MYVAREEVQLPFVASSEPFDASDGSAATVRDEVALLDVANRKCASSLRA